jgi:hypothetical protein
MKNKAQTFFKPIEIAILAAYLNKRELLSKRLAAIDVHQTYEPGEWDEERDGIAPQESAGGMGDEYTLANAVARICLSGVQDSLPQWATTRGDELVFARKRISPLKLPPRILLLEYLFEINWANSGPGYSWPESYYATQLPFFDVTIVTASNDSTDVLGYCDIAIGWFGKGGDFETEVGNVIKKHWKNLAGEYDQQKWVELFGTGEVDAETAEAWAEEAWAGQEEASS